MITINDKKYLNLEETVDWCVDAINDHYNRDRVLADFGIKVVGQFDTVEELEGVVGEEYGDAYLIGVTEPYSFYVWTRANPPTHEEDYWLDIGPIAIQGPTGPTPEITNDGTNIISINPETGTQEPIISIADIKGPRGTSIRTFAGGTAEQVPPYTDALAGDAAINANGGNLWRYVNNVWSRIGNLKGPQGPQGSIGPQGPEGPQGIQGPQGLRGDVGGLVNVRGLLDNIDQLPDPETLNNLTAAYLVGPNNNLYIQVGATPEDATWTNTGTFNAATLVTVQGVGQNLFDADTKLDKITTAATIPRAYCVNGAGEQVMTTITSGPVSGSIAYRNLSKSFEVGEENVDPKGKLYVANKDYVDRQINNLDRYVPSTTLIVRNVAGQEYSFGTYYRDDYHYEIFVEEGGKFRVNIGGIQLDNHTYADIKIIKPFIGGTSPMYLMKYMVEGDTTLHTRVGTASSGFCAPLGNSSIYILRTYARNPQYD